MLSAEALVERLRGLGNPADLEGMRRFGVGGTRAFGIKVGPIRDLAREIKAAERNSVVRHDLALALWGSGWREARLVAAMIDHPTETTPPQIDNWLRGIDSWDVCDGLCNELIRRVPWAWGEVARWSRDDHEYVRRAGFVTVATLAVHDRKAPDDPFVAFFPEIERAASDPRNAVKKGVNWAIRQIGKRNAVLHTAALELAERVHAIGTPPARWIASDALRELRSDAVRARMARR